MANNVAILLIFNATKYQQYTIIATLKYLVLLDKKIQDIILTNAIEVFFKFHNFYIFSFLSIIYFLLYN